MRGKQPPYRIAFRLDNPVTERLLVEQIALSSVLESARDGDTADCIVVAEGTPVERADNTPVFILPKGVLRLGEILDKLYYALSGRDNHLENDEDEIVFDAGRLKFFPARNELCAVETGEILRLTDKERLLLRVLHDAEGRGLTKRDLLKAVWGYADDAETHTLETHLYRLRQKLETVTTSDLIEVADGLYKIR